VWLGLGSAAFSHAQQQSNPAVQGIKGVKEEAVSDVKNIEKGNAASSGGVVNPGTKSDAQGVNKVNGVETIQGVKSDGRNAVLPTPPPPPPPAGSPPPVGVPPPPIVSAGGTTVPAAETPPPPAPPPIVPAGGTTVPAGGGSVGSAANIRAVQGVGGINTMKLQNLEAALNLKKDATVTPAGGTGKGRAAAAGLLSAPLEKQTGPKEDGRAGFQEFEKLQNNGS
jgi:hypothetical protein